MFLAAIGHVLRSQVHDVLPQANGSARDPAVGALYGR